MADNVQVTQGSGTKVGTDERTIAAEVVHIQRVDEIGAQAWAAAQNSTTTTTAAQIVAARDTRKRVVLVNQGTVDIYLGASSGVSASNGLLLKINASVMLRTTAAIFGITASGTAVVHYWEEYD